MLLAPTVIFLAAFMFYPIVYVFVMSFFRTNKLSDLTKFVGLANFVDRLQDQRVLVGRIPLTHLDATGVAVKFLAGHDSSRFS